MTPLQKVIKYGAIAFGFYLAFVILSAIIFGVTAIFGISVGINTYKSYTTEETMVSSFEDTFEGVNNLNIKLDISKLTVKTGNEFRVKVKNPTNEFYCEMDGNTLKIRDERSNVKLFDFSSDDVIPEIILYIPENQKLNNIEIEAGINETYIEKLVTNEIDIETGVGKFTIGNIKADILNISGGAGEVNIDKSTIARLKLEAGVGKFVINSEVLEEAEIEAGVGQLIVNLEGNKQDYKVKTTTGLGSLLVDGNKAGDNQIIGDGNRNIKVEAGVGEVKINFLEYSI